MCEQERQRPHSSAADSSRRSANLPAGPVQPAWGSAAMLCTDLSLQGQPPAPARSFFFFFFFYGLEEETLLSKYCPEGMMEFIYHGARFSLL